MSIPRLDASARLEALWAEHTGSLLGYALRRTNSREDAVEVIAEVFVVAWRRIDQVPPEPEARPWLFGVARKVMGNQRRGARRRDALTARLALHLQETVPDHAEDLTDPAAAAHLRNALATLHDRDRELILLTAWDGLTPTQAAATLGIPASTGRVRLHHARQRLRLAMERAQPAGHDPHGGHRASPPTPRTEVRT